MKGLNDFVSRHDDWDTPQWKAAFVSAATARDAFRSEVERLQIENQRLRQEAGFAGDSRDRPGKPDGSGGRQY